jgi:membrane protein
LLLEAIVTLLPVSIDLISQNIDRFIQLRGTVSLIGTLGLLWSASSAFTILVHQIDRAWEQARLRSFVQRRIMAIGMIVVIILLVGILWIFTGFLDLLAQFNIPILSDTHIRSTIAWKLITVAASPLFGFIVFFVLYRWVPTTPVKLSEAAWGALVVTVLWSITGLLFSWYLGSGLASYNLLYGSLAALAVLMLWFYLNSLILLFGAHLCASIAKWRENNKAL